MTARTCLAAAGALAALWPHVARACGVSASGAPAGICDASEVLDEKAGAARDRVGLSYGYTSSVLFFSNDLRTPTERHAVMASYEHPMRWKGSPWTLELGAGSLVSGFLLTPSGKATFSPGVLADVSLSHVLVASRGDARPFLLLSFSLAGVWAKTTEPAGARADYVALDFSATAAFGASLRAGPHVVTPFLALRLYGGPVFWTYAGESELGTDAYKYSLGPGLAVSLFHSRIGLSFGASLVGEKSLKGGMSVAF